MKFRSKYECISPNTHKLLFICTNMIYRANSVYKRLWQNQMKKKSPPKTSCQYGRCNIDIDRHYSCLQKLLPFMGTWEGGEPQRVYWGSSPPSPPWHPPVVGWELQWWLPEATTWPSRSVWAVWSSSQHVVQSKQLIKLWYCIDLTTIQGSQPTLRVISGDSEGMKDLHSC